MRIISSVLVAMLMACSTQTITDPNLSHPSYTLAGTPVSDDFERPDGTLGPNWTTLFGGWAIQSGMAVPTVATTIQNTTVWNQGTFNYGQFSQVIVGDSTLEKNHWFGPMVNATAGTSGVNAWALWAVWDSASGQFQLEMGKMVNGVSVCGDGCVLPIFSYQRVKPGDTLFLKATFMHDTVGNTYMDYQGFYNNHLLLDWSDNTNRTPMGRPGLFASHTGRTKFASWQGGSYQDSLVPPPSPPPPPPPVCHGKKCTKKNVIANAHHPS